MAHALGDQILFTAPPLTFPDVEQSAPSSLHRFDRQSTTLHLLAEDELGAFAVSPDGKRILFGRTVRDGDREFSRLMLMNADGTNPRTLHDFEQEMILIPAWRTADELVLQGKVDPAALRDEKRDRPLPCDVILYRITDAGLEPLRTLSRTWDERMKPAYSANRPAVAASRPPG